jgi:glycogen operon protein
LDFTLPAEKYGNQWIKVLDTNEDRADEPGATFGPGETFSVESFSVIVFKNPIFEAEE